MSRTCLSGRVVEVVILAITIAFFVFTSTAQSRNTYVSVIIDTPPKYELTEAIQVAVKNVGLFKGSVTVSAVMEELEDMEKQNLVSLPYHYTKASTTGIGNKGFLKGNQRNKRAAVESKVRKLLSNGKSSVAERPAPRDYQTQDQFIAAYVSWKEKMEGDEAREKYAKILGGMSQFRRDCKNEAKKLWRAK